MTLLDQTFTTDGNEMSLYKQENLYYISYAKHLSPFAYSQEQAMEEWNLRLFTYCGEIAFLQGGYINA